MSKGTSGSDMPEPLAPVSSTVEACEKFADDLAKSSEKEMMGKSAVATVSATYKDKTGTLIVDKADETVLDVQRFVTQPAQVYCHYGMTINMGDYESARVDVGITIPCYKEEIESAYRYASSIASELIVKETKEIKDAKAGRFKKTEEPII